MTPESTVSTPAPDSEVSLSDSQRAVYDVVADTDRGVTAPEIGERVGMPRTTVIDRLNELLDEGLIETAKASEAVRLYFTQLSPQWGSYELLTKTEREYLRTGETGGVPERVILERMIIGLQDYAEDIRFDEAPRREDVALLAARGQIEEPIEDLSFLALRGGLMRVQPEESMFDQLYLLLTSDLPSYLRRVRRRLQVDQQEVAAQLAVDFPKEMSTYKASLSKWERGEADRLSSNEVSAIVQILREEHCEQYGPFDVEPDWLD